MKKWFAKLALALVPVALYLGVFLAFEPNNYFGLRAQGNDNTPIARIRAFEQQPQRAVVVGDSRLAHFDMALAGAASGHTWANLAYGGASLAESIDEFSYVCTQYPDIERAVLGVSFYTLNSSYGSVNRMATIQTQLTNPAAYVFNLEYNINMLTALSDKLAGRADAQAEETATWSEADYLDENGAVLPYRKDLIAYAATLYGNCAVPSAQPAVEYDASGAIANPRAVLNALLACTPADSKFSVNTDVLARLCALAADCKQRGVAFTVVLPPMDESVRALVCVPLGIDTAMQPALQALQACGAQVLDYEWENAPAFTDAQFYDGFHLDTRSGLPQWTETMFGEVK